MVLNTIKEWAAGSDILEDEDFEQENDSNNYEYSPSDFENTASSTNETDRDFSNRPSQMVMFEPRSYSESQGIADHLKGGRGCIINLHRVNKDQAKRIIDFLSGVVYAIEGDVQKIGSNVFLTTPSNFGVYGEISQIDE